MVEYVCVLGGLQIRVVYELVKVSLGSNTNLLGQHLVSLCGGIDCYFLGGGSSIRNNSFLLSTGLTLDLSDLLGGF